MLFRTSPDKFWNLIAKKYAASPIPDIPAYQKKIDKITSYFSSKDNVLDIGCGTGTQCVDIASNVNHVTGIDISSKLLAIAEKRKVEREITNVEFIETTVFDNRFEHGSFDKVMAFYVLHFCENLEEVIGRVHNILKPGGLLILETVCFADKNIVTGKIIRICGKLGFFPLINLLSTHQIEQALEQAGFEIVEKTKFSTSTDEYTYFAKKTEE
jgi:ubiquinone/menaquinone biosynthesis C-methylase UbiE